MHRALVYCDYVAADNASTRLEEIFNMRNGTCVFGGSWIMTRDFYPTVFERVLNPSYSGIFKRVSVYGSVVYGEGVLWRGVGSRSKD